MSTLGEIFLDKNDHLDDRDISYTNSVNELNPEDENNNKYQGFENSIGSIRELARTVSRTSQIRSSDTNYLKI